MTIDRNDVAVAGVSLGMAYVLYRFFRFLFLHPVAAFVLYLVLLGTQYIDHGTHGLWTSAVTYIEMWLMILSIGYFCQGDVLNGLLSFFILSYMTHMLPDWWYSQTFTLCVVGLVLLLAGGMAFVFYMADRQAKAYDEWVRLNCPPRAQSAEPSSESPLALPAPATEVEVVEPEPAPSARKDGPANDNKTFNEMSLDETIAAIQRVLSDPEPASH